MDQIKAQFINGLLLLIPLAFTYAVIVLNKKIAETKAKIEENTKITKKVEILVDGRYGAILRRQADTLKILSGWTNNPGDLLRANSAKDEADRHDRTMKETMGIEVLEQTEEQVIKADDMEGVKEIRVVREKEKA